MSVRRRSKAHSEAGGRHGRSLRHICRASAVAAILALAACTTHDRVVTGQHGTASKLIRFDASSTGPGWSIYDSGPFNRSINAQNPNLTYVRDHILYITTKGSAGSGLCLCKPGYKTSKPYGRWDVRAKVSTGEFDHGYAILLWPNAENWPVGGELDFAEFPDADRSRLQTTVHYSATNRLHEKFTLGNFTQWHTYSVIWQEHYVQFLLDGRPVYSVTDPASIPHGAMHLALQAGVNKGVTDPTGGTSTLAVKWVKITQA